MRSQECNENKQREIHNTMSLLPEWNINLPSQKVNKSTLKYTPTLLKNATQMCYSINEQTMAPMKPKQWKKLE